MEFIMNINSVFEDLKTLSHYKDGDKLAVRDGKLIITKQGFSQSFVRTIRNLFQSGYNRYDVAKHLDSMFTKIEQTVKANQLTEEEKKEYRKLLFKAKRVVSDVSSSYKPEPFSCSSSVPARHLSLVFKKIDSLSKTLGQPQFDANEDFNKMNVNELRTISPNKIAPERIVDLSKKAEKRVVTKMKKVAVYTFVVFEAALAGIPAFFLTAAKWIFWNPIEFICKGEITTKNPVEWLGAQLEHFAYKHTDDTTRARQNHYANWLFLSDEITMSHVDAVRQLPYISAEFTENIKSLEIFFADLDDLNNYFKSNGKDSLLDKINNDQEIKNTLNQIFAKKQKKFTILVDILEQEKKEDVINSLKKVLEDQKNVHTAISKTHKAKISYTAMKTLYSVLSDRKQVKKIVVHGQLACKEVKDGLVKKGFVNNLSESQTYLTYVRD